MKKIESLDALRTWKEYLECSKAHLKLLDGEGPFHVTKEKVVFDLGGKPWPGYAFLVGKTAPPAARKLRKEGAAFKEGVCRLEGEVLHVGGLPAKLVEGARKTLLKMHIGYEIVLADEPGAAPATDGPTGGALEPEARRRKLDELRKLGSDLDRLLAALGRRASSTTGA